MPEGEVPAGLGCPPDPGVDGLDRVRREDDAAELGVETAKRRELTPAFSQSRTIAGHFLPQASANSANRSSAASSVAVQTGLWTRAILSPS